MIFSRPRVLKKNNNLYNLYFDVKTLRSLINTLPSSSLLYQDIASHLHEALLKLDFSLPDHLLEESASISLNIIRECLEYKNGTLSPEILSIGNAHLDHAWLWQIRETERKAARTIVNMLSYLERDDSFSFTFTQPVQIESIKRRYPSIFKILVEAEKNNRFEMQGISWVEPDCMLPSGESFIRQFIFGRESIKNLFGEVKGNVFWVPDSFGYNAQLPQILAGCDISYFVTSKIGWNDTNRFPYDLFIWEGLDGTTIPSHMIIDAYEGKNEVEQIVNVWNKVQHKDIQKKLMRSIGEGDGGGGTMLEDLEYMKRMRDLQGVPKNRWVKLQQAMEEIFTEDCVKQLPKYKGELYLELHRGTYTVQSEVKKLNKELESALLDADIILSEAFVNKDKSFQNAHDMVKDAWRILLTNQFHDILPGSSIKEVIDEAINDYKRALSLVEDAIKLLNKKRVSPDFHFGTKEDLYDSKASLNGNTITTSWGVLTLEDGSFTSITCHGREYVEKGKIFNKITLSPDLTVNWDAWDMEEDMIPLREMANKPYYVDFKELGDSVVVTTKRRLTNNSTMEQRIIINNYVERVDFHTLVDWHEDHKILRSEFESTISSSHAEYSTQFGYISRSTLDNNSYERAQFEVPSQRFVHLGDTQNSLIITSDSKYGYRVKDKTMSISLLRSPKAPDSFADIGVREFTYSISFASGGDEGIRKAIRRGYDQINEKDTYLPKLPFSFITLKGSVILECVKVSEEHDGIIIRFYEAEGSEGVIKLCLDDSVKQVEEINLIETKTTPLKEQEIHFSPFKIRSLKLSF